MTDTATQVDRGEKRARAVPKPSMPGNGSKKVRLTISLSEKSMEAFDEIKSSTDADTDSEVFRNALRLHLMLLRAHKNGVRLFMKNERGGGSEEALPVNLFVESE